MRFMLLQNYGGVESGCPPMPEWITRGHQGAHRVPAGAQPRACRAGRAGGRPGAGRARAGQAVVSDGTGAPVITDGPFPSPRSCWPGTGWWTWRRPSGPSRSPPGPRRRRARTGRRSASPSRCARCSAPPTRTCDAVTGRRAGTEGLLRELAPQVLGAVVRRYGGLRRCRGRRAGGAAGRGHPWPPGGTPDNPLGWLIRVAARRLADQYRSEDARRRREVLAASWSLTAPAGPVPGEQARPGTTR